MDRSLSIFVGAVLLVGAALPRPLLLRRSRGLSGRGCRVHVRGAGIEDP